MAKPNQGNGVPKDVSVGHVSTLDFNAAPKRQTVKIRGTGAATKGTKCSDKLG
jgi:hypothetical protein